MKSAEQRKAESIARLRAEGIPVLESLPVIEDASQARRRSAEEIGKRAVASWLAIQAARDRDAGRYTPEVAHICMNLLLHYGLQGELTANEAKILSNQGDAQDVINMGWKYEAYWALLWALGMVDELGKPDRIVDLQAAYRAVADCQDFAAFMQKARLRDIEQILDAADLIYRYDWACVDARINGRDMPGGLNASVTLERHAGLNWLIDAGGSDDWDNPDVST